MKPSKLRKELDIELNFIQQTVSLEHSFQVFQEQVVDYLDLLEE